jgi:UDP-N-acetylmuramoyl-L-alanyl-D-glutamate--2,6-diaminopimelate ligase
MNLTQDHLDYHGTMASYYDAKKILFEGMVADGGDGVAVINVDDPAGEKLAAEFKGRLKVITFGFGANADFRASEVILNTRGQQFALAAKGKSYLVRIPVVGRFNIMNGLAALAAVSAVGIHLRDGIKLLAEVAQTPGRMEFVGGDRVSVYVDYAHTPDALEKACATLRELNPSRLITVFGCGGDRDRTKRPIMGAAAAKGSDICIVTSDNPRSEDPDAIMDEIKAGMQGVRFETVKNRREAIQLAIEISLPQDIILIAGKGHETYQEIHGYRQKFDDRDEAREALEVKRKKMEAEFLLREEERERKARNRSPDEEKGEFSGE